MCVGGWMCVQAADIFHFLAARCKFNEIKVSVTSAFSFVLQEVKVDLLGKVLVFV